MTDQFIYCSITGATITPNGHEGFYFSDEYGKTYYLSALAWRTWDLLPLKGFTFTHLPKQLHTRHNWIYCGEPYGCLKNGDIYDIVERWLDEDKWRMECQ